MRGGYGSSEHGSLADRVRRTSPPEPPEPPEPSAPLATAASHPARHCLVDGSPSLLVEWRRGTSGWEGRVVSVAWIDAVGWATVERWLPREAIEPL